jgi:adenosylcobinamide kinase/adenosylcobinamide-phosphate guanylyltransferase
MKDVTLVLGGCKSGKSRHALYLSEGYKRRQLFMATCIPHDDEMKKRVDRHKKERNDKWRTIDVPLELCESIASHGNEGNVLLVDCLTLWISNLLMVFEDEARVLKEVERLVTVLDLVSCPVVLVSNEVGAGIVPENRLARLFRDIAGVANQKIADGANRVVWMVAGIPVVVKP